MKESKLVTPTLLFLVAILLLIFIYYNFAFKPLETKVDSIVMQNELLKDQRIEIEIAMKNKDALIMNIQDMKETLSKGQEITLIDGKMLADDINSNAKPFSIHLNNIIIDEPQVVPGSTGEQKTLIFIPATLSFITTYENGANFIGSFENSMIGLYSINSVDIFQGERAQLNWNVSLSLYYYGDQASVPTIDEGDQISND